MDDQSAWLHRYNDTIHNCCYGEIYNSLLDPAYGYNSKIRIWQQIIKKTIQSHAIISEI